MISAKDYYREFRTTNRGIVPVCVVSGSLCQDFDCRSCAFASTAFSRGKSPAINTEQTLDRVLDSVPRVL